VTRDCLCTAQQQQVIITSLLIGFSTERDVDDVLARSCYFMKETAFARFHGTEHQIHPLSRTRRKIAVRGKPTSFPFSINHDG
jgi:hypothetical protein